MQWRRGLSWLPGDPGWRVAVGFMVGSTLFGLGSFPAYTQVVDARVLGATFFVGSVFFTAAAFGQYRQAPGRRSLLWWAAAVQLAGTLLFNLSTGNALVETLTPRQADRLVWAPDIFGSVAFLVASQLGWLAVRHAPRPEQHDPDWWSAVLNYLGSVFFMASALAAFVLPTTGDVANIAVVNGGTFLGAACFLTAAWAVAPRRAD